MKSFLKLWLLIFLWPFLMIVRLIAMLVTDLAELASWCIRGITKLVSR